MSHWESSGKSNDWYTPKYIMDALGCHFTMDVAAPFEGPRYVSCDGWFYDRSLERQWNGYIWMNSPFDGRNGLVPWLDKFFSHGNGVALTPDRTSAPWWQDAASKADAILFIDGKVKFERPDGSLGKSPSNGTTLFAAGNEGYMALHRAQGRGLGIMMERRA